MRRGRLSTIGSAVVVGLAFLGTTLAGCGASSTPREGAVATPPPTITALPTVTAMPTSTTRPTATTGGKSGCTGDFYGQPQPTTAVGALSVTTPIPALQYPYSEVPASASSTKPYQVANGAQPNPPVNPSLGTGYVVVLCNETSTAHTLTSLTVNIASFSATSGMVREWSVCNGGEYDASSKQVIVGGCGGGLAVDDYLTATLPSDSTGASGSAFARSGYANLPIQIAPGHAFSLTVGVSGLTSQGMYSLKIGVAADHGTPVMLAPGSGGSFLIASAVQWTGKNCQTPAMQSQMPPASQPTFYVCAPA